MDPEKRGYRLRILFFCFVSESLLCVLDSIWLAGGTSRRSAKQSGQAFAQAAELRESFTCPPTRNSWVSLGLWDALILEISRRLSTFLAICANKAAVLEAS
jgi:hypothetical protein